MLTLEDEHSRTIWENLQLPIQRQLYKKLKSFSYFFIAFLECTLNLEHFEEKKKKMSLIAQVFLKLFTLKDVLKCIKGLVSENLSVLNVLMTELFVVCSKFYFRKDLCYIETSWVIEDVNHLTGFCLILPFIERKYV